MAESDSNTSDWEIMSISENEEEIELAKRKNITGRFIQRFVHRPCKKSRVLMKPVGIWKAEAAFQSVFQSEVELRRSMYRSYRGRCLQKGIAPVWVNTYVLQQLVQTGWILKRGIFTLNP